MGAGASTNAMLNILLNQRRYINGLKPEKYYLEILFPKMPEIFNLVGIDVDEGLSLFLQFYAMDTGNEGKVSISKICDFFMLEKSKFNERIFSSLGMNLDKRIGFEEYLICLWNICTYDFTLMALYIFQIFDMDKHYSLSVPEYDAMLRMIHYNIDSEAKNKLLEHFFVNGSGDGSRVNYEEYCKILEKNHKILQPALNTRGKLRTKTLGVRCWEGKTKRRKQDNNFIGGDASQILKFAGQEK